MNSGYTYTRKWFDFCFENSEAKSNHTALYLYIVEYCNRLGWKEEFGLPTNMAMEALSISSYKTYQKTFEQLVEWKFIKLIKPSKNQFSSRVIALVKNTKAHTKAHTNAVLNHEPEQCRSIDQSIVVINKPLNLKTCKPQTCKQLIGLVKNFSEFLKFKIDNGESEFKKIQTDLNKIFKVEKRFSIPEQIEILDYFKKFSKERKLQIIPRNEAEKFYNFYTSKNWYVGKNKMKDWKGAARNFMLNK